MTDNTLLDLHTSGTEQRTLSPIEGILGSDLRLGSTDVPILDSLLKMTSPSAVHLPKTHPMVSVPNYSRLFHLSAKFSNELTYWSFLCMAAQWCRDWRPAGPGFESSSRLRSLCEELACACEVNLSVGAGVDGRLSLGVSRATAWRPARHLPRRSPYGSWDGLQPPWMDAFVLF